MHFWVAASGISMGDYWFSLVTEYKCPKTFLIGQIGSEIPEIQGMRKKGKEQEEGKGALLSYV